MKIDLLYLAHDREEFTEASTHVLLENTDWSFVRSVHIYFDGMGSLAAQLFARSVWGRQIPVTCQYEKFGGPVGVMRHYISSSTTPKDGVTVKIDNDVIVPEHWTEDVLYTFSTYDELDILGLEPPASRTPNPSTGIRITAPEVDCLGVGYARTDSVGGVCAFRPSCFIGTPLPAPYANGRGGFGDWQVQNRQVVKGWITPPLRLFLLDRLPMEPWTSLSDRYNSIGIQRPWTNYENTKENADALWGWWDGASDSTAAVPRSQVVR